MPSNCEFPIHDLSTKQVENSGNKNENQQVKSKSKKRTDDERLADDIKKLKEYLKQIENNPPKEPKRFSDRTEKLAQPKLKYLKATYENFKTVLPKYKIDMIKEDLLRLDKNQHITTEQLKDYMERRAEIEKERIRAHRKRFIEFEKTLTGIEQQCRESIMNDIVKKFAIYVANRAIQNDYPKIISEQHQHLCHGLICNMLMSLGINYNSNNNNDSDCYKSVDLSLFKGLANVLADIILKTLIKIQIIDPNKYKLPVDVSEIKCSQIDCINRRARRAVNKNCKKIEEKIEQKLNNLKCGCKINKNMDENDLKFERFLKSTQCKQHVWKYEVAEKDS